MNAESSRSHLIIGITIETTNKTTGQVLTGKVRINPLSLSLSHGRFRIEPKYISLFFLSFPSFLLCYQQDIILQLNSKEWTR